MKFGKELLTWQALKEKVLKQLETLTAVKQQLAQEQQELARVKEELTKEQGWWAEWMKDKVTCFSFLGKNFVNTTKAKAVIGEVLLVYRKENGELIKENLVNFFVSGTATDLLARAMFAQEGGMEAANRKIKRLIKTTADYYKAQAETNPTNKPQAQ